MGNSKNMQLTKALVLVIVLAFFVSCKNRVPSQYPNKKEMTAILADLHMAEATIASQNQGGKSVEYTGFYKSVLDKHGLTKVQFDSALAWYTAHPSVYNELYDDVIAKLSDIEAQSLSDLSKLEEKEKELAAKLVVQSLWIDTAAIKYPYADTLDTRFPFEFVIDSLSGGDLRLNANYKFININKVTKVKYYMQLITCFADSTSDTLRTEVYRTLQGQATMLTAKLPGDKKLVKAKGFLLDHQKLDKPRVDISHMQLEFIPSGNINYLKK